VKKRKQNRLSWTFRLQSEKKEDKYMNLNELMWSTRNLYIRGIDNAVANANGYINRIRLTTRLVPREPDYVAALIRCLSCFYSNYLSNFNNQGIEGRFISQFIHRSPIIEIGNNSPRTRCELGDILFVHINKDIRRKKTGNAILFQAKRSGIIPCGLSTVREMLQLRLYREWPGFTYNGRRINVFPKAPHTGAKYLIIKDPHRNFTNARCFSAMPSEDLFSSSKLSRELFDFHIFNSGRPFIPRMLRDSWSKLICNLIDFNVGTFNQRAGRFIRSSRSRRNNYSLICDSNQFRENNYSLFSINKAFDNEPPKSILKTNDNSEKGMYILLLETHEID